MVGLLTWVLVQLALHRKLEVVPEELAGRVSVFCKLGIVPHACNLKLRIAVSLKPS